MNEVLDVLNEWFIRIEFKSDMSQIEKVAIFEDVIKDTFISTIELSSENKSLIENNLDILFEILVEKYLSSSNIFEIYPQIIKNSSFVSQLNFILEIKNLINRIEEKELKNRLIEIDQDEKELKNHLKKIERIDLKNRLKSLNLNLNEVRNLNVSKFNSQRIFKLRGFYKYAAIILILIITIPIYNYIFLKKTNSKPFISKKEILKNDSIIKTNISKQPNKSKDNLVKGIKPIQLENLIENYTPQKYDIKVINENNFGYATSTKNIFVEIINIDSIKELIISNKNKLSKSDLKLGINKIKELENSINCYSFLNDSLTIYLNENLIESEVEIHQTKKQNNLILKIRNQHFYIQSNSSKSPLTKISRFEIDECDTE